MDFGYHPPTGERGIETIRPREFVADLHRVLDMAAPNFTSLWVSDHLQFGSKYRLECWTQLAWMAARYPHALLGTVVMSNSFRSPSLMAKMAASLQELSGGRLVLGYGAGWHEEEYVAYGFPYPSPGERVAMLAEGIEVIRALWTQGPVTYNGKYYQLKDAYCEPRPNPLPPIMIGGGGEKRTLRLVARLADWWNDVGRPRDELRHKLAMLQQHCKEAGRDFSAMRKSVVLRVYMDRDHATAVRRAQEQPQAAGQQPVVGDPAAVRDQLKEVAEMGFDMVQLVFPRFPETDDIHLFVDEVLPAFR